MLLLGKTKPAVMQRMRRTMHEICPLAACLTRVMFILAACGENTEIWGHLLCLE